MRIVTDTASLFAPGENQDSGLFVVPACVIHEDQVYSDYEDITPETFLEIIASGATLGTSQPAIGDLIDTFESSEEETLALFIGDGLSGGYQNAVS